MRLEEISPAPHSCSHTNFTNSRSEAIAVVLIETSTCWAAGSSSAQSKRFASFFTRESACDGRRQASRDQTIKSEVRAVNQSVAATTADRKHAAAGHSRRRPTSHPSFLLVPRGGPGE